MSPVTWTLLTLAVVFVLGLYFLLRGVSGLDAYFKSAAAVIKETDWDVEYRALCDKERGQ